MEGQGTARFHFKELSREGIEAALEKATRYRLLNEPSQAESICLDILQVDPDNQEALVLLLLSKTDLFGEGMGVDVSHARDLLPKLATEYERLYYGGIICERQAKVVLRGHAHGREPHAYEWLRRAMEQFEQAEAMSPPGNDDAILRWNTCARLIMRHNLHPRHDDGEVAMNE